MNSKLQTPKSRHTQDRVDLNRYANLYWNRGSWTLHLGFSCRKGIWMDNLQERNRNPKHKSKPESSGAKLYHGYLNNRLTKMGAWTSLLKQGAGVDGYLEMSRRCVDEPGSSLTQPREGGRENTFNTFLLKSFPLLSCKIKHYGLFWPFLYSVLILLILRCQAERWRCSALCSFSSLQECVRTTMMM